jgi:hypothetical protein
VFLDVVNVYKFSPNFLQEFKSNNNKKCLILFSCTFVIYFFRKLTVEFIRSSTFFCMKIGKKNKKIKNKTKHLSQYM